MKLKPILKWTFLSAAWLLPNISLAAVPAIDSITAANYESIVKELSANFTYSSVNSASSLGSVWGLELGLIGGYTKTPEILNIVKTYQPSTTLEDKFPHASLLARVGVPYGITIEGVLFPKKTISDVSMQHYGGALMWTVTDLYFQDWPVKVATKAFFTKSSISYGQSVRDTTLNLTVNGTIDFDDTTYGLQALVSKKFLVFDPYLGLGWVHAKGDLSVNAAGNATVFSPSFTSGKSASSTPTSVQLLAGLDIQLFVLALGAEYQRTFGKDSYTGRLSFRF